jgi:hypothetical protein
MKPFSLPDSVSFKYRFPESKIQDIEYFNPWFFGSLCVYISQVKSRMNPMVRHGWKTEKMDKPSMTVQTFRKAGLERKYDGNII